MVNGREGQQKCWIRIRAAVSRVRASGVRPTISGRAGRGSVRGSRCRTGRRGTRRPGRWPGGGGWRCGCPAMMNWLEGALHLGDGLVAVGAVDDELGDERVVVGRDDALGVVSGIDADAVAAGDVEGGDGPAEGVNFSGCSALMRHSMAWPRDVEAGAEGWRRGARRRRCGAGP